MPIKTQIYLEPDDFGIVFAILKLFGGEELADVDGYNYYRIDKEYLIIAYRCNSKNEQFIVSLGDIMDFWVNVDDNVETERWKIECKERKFEGLNICMKIRIYDKYTDEEVLDKWYSCKITNPKELIDDIKKDVYKIINDRK